MFSMVVWYHGGAVNHVSTVSLFQALLLLLVQEIYLGSLRK